MKLLKTFLISLIYLTTSPVMSQENSSDVISKNMVTKISPFSVKITMDRIIALAVEREITIIGRVNHGERARSVGRDIGEVEVFIGGGSKPDTMYMNIDPRIGFDLPLKLIVWDDKGVTKIGAISADSFAERWGLDKESGPVNAQRNALEQIMTLIITPETKPK